jgi:hypothetical protein
MQTFILQKFYHFFLLFFGISQLYGVEISTSYEIGAMYKWEEEIKNPSPYIYNSDIIGIRYKWDSKEKVKKDYYEDYNNIGVMYVGDEQKL